MQVLKKMIVFLFLIFGFDGDCMKTVSIAVQGVGSRDLTATIDSRTAPISFRTMSTKNASSVPLVDGVFGITLAKAEFPSQEIDVKNSQSQVIVFKILIQKSEYDQPVVALSNIQDPIKCALYRRCSGGGNAFVLAIGDRLEDVSLQSVQEHQFMGKMQAFLKVS